MSFPQPPPIGVYGASSVNGSREDLSAGVQGLTLDSPGRRKKRPVRAFHTVGSGPVAPSAPVTPTFAPTPTQASFFPPGQSPYQYSPAGAFSPQTPIQNQSPYQQQQQQQYSQQTSPQYAGAPHPASAYPQASEIPISLDHNRPVTHAPVPQDMNQLGKENKDLSLQEHRYYGNQEWTSPVDDSHRSFMTFQSVCPPDSTVQFHATDQGTSSSKFIRSSMYYVPESEQLRSATKLPVSVTIRPFAPLLKSEAPVPVVDMRRLDFNSSDVFDNGPIRCRRCRTYVNPSMSFTHNGRFVCNICQFGNNAVPADYSAMLDAQGMRVDKFVRPELHRGVYDLIVPSEYNFGGVEGKTNPLHHIFLVDISEQSRKQNLPMLLADAIRATLYNEEYEDGEESKHSGVKYGIITFDKRVHFYNLSPTLESTQIVISSDLDDPFVPFSDGLFADPNESRNVIEDALNHLESLSSSESMADNEPCFSAAARTAMLCLETVGGGKITSVLSSLPTWGPGSLKFKDNKAVGRTPSAEAEQKIFLPDNEYYKLLAKDFIRNSIGLDVHVVSPASVDLSNIGWLSSVSGGTVSRWPNFDFERDGRAFSAKFVSSVKKVRGYQGQLKLRCSSGLQVSQYYGTSSSITESSVGGSVQDPVIPTISEDKTFTVLFEFDGKLQTKYDCHFQAALLYTDPEGIRKVRVINLVCAVSERLEEVFNFADENAVVTAIVRDTLSFIGKQPLNELRDSINLKLVDILTQYRAMSELGHNRNRTLTNQLLFPDSLKHLPSYILAFIKSKALRSYTGISADARLADAYQMLNMPVERLMYHLFPALVELHSLEEDDALFEDSNGFISLPRYIDLSLKHIEHGVYILCDGINVFVWVDPEANILLVKDLFGENIESVSEISPVIDELPELPTHISEQARNLVKYFQAEIVGIPSVGSAGIRLVRPGIDGSVAEFKESLVDDVLHGSITSNSGPGFPDYLTNLHKAIHVQLENDKSSNKVKKSVTAAEHSHDTLAQRLINF